MIVMVILPMLFYPIFTKTRAIFPILNATFRDGQTIKHIHRKMACIKMFTAD